MKRLLAIAFALFAVSTAHAQQKTTAQIKNDITTLFPTTGAGLITANRLREVTNEMADSYANKGGDTFNGPVTIPFTQSGTGATARTVDAKLKDGLLSATDFSNLQVALDAAKAAGKGLFVPAGTYTISAGLSESALSNIRIVGEGRFITVIKLAGNGDVFQCANCNFVTIEGLSFQHASGTGSGVTFTGTSSSNTVRDSFLATNPGNGLSFIGSSGAQQSENRAYDNLFLDNETEQLYFEWSNDYKVDRNSFGRSGGGYPATGMHFVNASAGNIINNFAWNNVVALKLESSSYVRIEANRLEESRNQGLLAVGGTKLLINGNTLHTNSQSSTGTFAALDIINSTGVTITSNNMFSWDSATYKHSHAILLEGTADTIDIGVNTMSDSLFSNINTTTTTNVTLVSGAGVNLSSGSSYQINGTAVINSSGGHVLAKLAVASLPTCNAGAEGTLYAVTDATSATFNAAIVGGGTNHVMAYCNGTGWTVH